MKNIILALAITLSLTSCQSFTKSITEAFEKISNSVSINKNSEEKAIDKGKGYLAWAWMACLGAAILCVILSFKVPGLIHLAGILFMASVGFWATLQAINFIDYFSWLLIIFLVFSGGALWYSKSKYYNQELSLKDNIIEDLGLHFDDEEGENKLAKESHDAYTMYRKSRELKEAQSQNRHSIANNAQKIEVNSPLPLPSPPKGKDATHQKT